RCPNRRRNQRQTQTNLSLLQIPPPTSTGRGHSPTPRRTKAHGRLEKRNQDTQTMQGLHPITPFQLCKRRELEDGLRAHLFKIVTYCEQGGFVKAHDSYMYVTIGRATL
ncbi:hypothetical protein ACHAXR_000891, partial [Thalassiosira sp. AJA248-18]